MSTAAPQAIYPAAIEQKLRHIRRRQCALAIVRAVLLAAAALLTGMLAAMLADWSFTLFSTSARTALTLSALGVAIATLLLTGVRPVAASCRLRQAAREVDQVVPHLEERWTTVAAFAESNHRSRSPITTAMLQQVTSEAVALAGLVEPAQVATLAKTRRAAAWLLASALAVAAFLALDWQHHRVLLARFWSPFSDISATQIESLSGDLIAPRGEPVNLVFRTSGLSPHAATLEFIAEGADTEALNLTPNDDSPERFAYNIPALEATLKYRVQAGDSRTHWHTVTAIDRPSLAEVKVTMTPPAYVDRPVYEKEYLPDRIQAVEGSHLRLAFRAKDRLKQFELAIARHELNGARRQSGNNDPSAGERLLLSADTSGWYRYETVLETDMIIQPMLVSPHGLRENDVQTCRIRVIADRAPVARVISPNEEMAVDPNEVIDVKFEAHDDHGIAKAELVVYDQSRQPGEPPAVLGIEEIPLGDQASAPHVMATAKLDLSKYALQSGSSISFAVRVTDNRLTRADASDANAPRHGATSPSEEAKPADPPLGKNVGDNASGSELTEKHSDNTNSIAAAKAGESPGRKSAGELPPDIQNNDNGTPAAKSLAKQPSDAMPAATSDEKIAAAPAKTSADSDADEAAGAPPGKPSIAPETAKGATGSIADASNSPQPPATKSELAAPAALKSGSEPGAESAASPSSTSTNRLVPKSDEPSGGRQSMASGDLTSPDRHSDFADDLAGQFTESNRQRLKVEEKIVSAAEPGEASETIQIKIRARLEQIDRQLKPAEEALERLVEVVTHSGIADPQIQTLTEVDGRLAKVDRLIADLRTESNETPLAFAGLHMVEIAATQIAPARDRVFALTRQPDVDPRGNSTKALHHVSRARELLAELLVHYDRLVREQKLADAIDQTAKIYEVYVENLHRFLRAQSKPNPNPLQRAMAVVEVDQDYLDRLRQVVEMRRELMAEFARMLADDPRLLSKYMDLIKRRQTSLRDRLTELHERQQAIATELSGWLGVDASQRDAVWMLAAEVRLQDIAPLVQEASQLAERIASQFPLGIDPGLKTSATVIDAAKQVSVRARSAAAKSRRLLRDPFDETIELATEIDEMSLLLVELDAALERLAFEKGDEEVVDYTNKRLAESRALVERIAGWAETALHLQSKRFHGLAKVDQHQLALQTEQLRTDIDGIDQQLQAEFRSGVPASVTVLAKELKQLMESITFNQQSATFKLTAEQLPEAEAQQALALQAFQRAEELFDQIRRQVIEESDKIDPDDPNIADLTDPTLDELLERLEREPNLNALLGIPNRPRNLRVISDFFATAQGNIPVPSVLEQAAQQARQRAEKEQEEARRMRPKPASETDKSEEEWRQVANAEEAQEKLEAEIEKLERQAEDPATEPDKAARLRQLAEQLEQMRKQLGSRAIDDQQWREMVRSDQMKAILKAAAKGEPLPDTQWNRIVSSLDDGLWQVRRRTPPEDYRRAIEQYQERIRTLLNLEAADETR